MELSLNSIYYNEKISLEIIQRKADFGLQFNITKLLQSFRQSFFTMGLY